MGVSGQSHAPAALPPGKTRYPLYRTLGKPSAGPDGCGKSRPHREVITLLPVCSHRSPVITVLPVCSHRSPVITLLPVCSHRSPVITLLPVCSHRSPVITVLPVCSHRSPVITVLPVCSHRSPESPVSTVCEHRISHLVVQLSYSFTGWQSDFGQLKEKNKCRQIQVKVSIWQQLTGLFIGTP